MGRSESVRLPFPFFIVTHRPEDEPTDAGFTFVNGFDEAIARPRGSGRQGRVGHGRSGADPPGSERRIR